MTGTAADADDDGLSFGTDRIAMNVHGNADSHIDALCHVMFDGALYNGVPADAVTASGAEQLSIAAGQGRHRRAGRAARHPRGARNGLAGAGRRRDASRTCSRPRSGSRSGSAPVTCCSFGSVTGGRRNERHPWDAAAARAGLHPTVIPMLAERQIAVLGSDSNSDTAPSAVTGVDFPVHVLAINALGLQLLDYLQFEEVLPLCSENRQWSFLCVIAPLRLPRGTGSPVNPIAIL